jgi:hypothetical protein
LVGAGDEPVFRVMRPTSPQSMRSDIDVMRLPPFGIMPHLADGLTPSKKMLRMLINHDLVPRFQRSSAAHPNVATVVAGPNVNTAQALYGFFGRLAFDLRGVAGVSRHPTRIDAFGLQLRHSRLCAFRVPCAK